MAPVAPRTAYEGIMKETAVLYEEEGCLRGVDVLKRVLGRNSGLEHCRGIGKSERDYLNELSHVVSFIMT